MAVGSAAPRIQTAARIDPAKARRAGRAPRTIDRNSTAPLKGPCNSFCATNAALSQACKVDLRRISIPGATCALCFQRSTMPAATKAAKRAKRTKKGVRFHSYINKVLKQVHPKISMSQKSMAIMNSFVLDTFDKISTEAGKVNKKQTLTSREVQSALRLVLPGELAKHAVSEATKAATKFANA